MLKKIKEPVWMGLAIALVAAAAPVTVAIWSSANKTKEIEVARISKEKDLELATREQRFKMRMGVLDRAIDPSKAPEDRKQVLRFLVAVADDDTAVKQWAEAELASIDIALRKALSERDQARTSLWQSSPLGCVLSTVHGSPRDGGWLYWKGSNMLVEGITVDNDCKNEVIHAAFMEMDQRDGRYYWKHWTRDDFECSCDKALQVGNDPPGLLANVAWAPPPPGLKFK